MGLKKILSLFIALSFFLEHLGLNSFEVHFNSQVQTYQYVDIDNDGDFEHLNESLGQDSVFKAKKVFCIHISKYQYFVEDLVAKSIIQFVGLKYNEIFYDDIFKPPIFFSLIS